jgi:hypothetical protein
MDCPNQIQGSTAAPPNWPFFTRLNVFAPYRHIRNFL